MKAVRTTTSALRRLTLAQQGLLRWSGGQGEFAEGAPWLEQHQGLLGTLQVLKRLKAVRLDPVTVVERSHQLVFLNRVGGYKTSYLKALYLQKQVFEYWAQARCILPTEGWPLFRHCEEALGPTKQSKAARALEARAYRAGHGPYILPILEGEHFVGRLDARMDRANKQLAVRRIFWEQESDRCRAARVEKP